MGFHSEHTSICDTHWTELTTNHDARLSIVMIHQATIMHRLSTLEDIEFVPELIEDFNL